MGTTINPLSGSNDPNNYQNNVYTNPNLGSFVSPYGDNSNNPSNGLNSGLTFNNLGNSYANVNSTPDFNPFNLNVNTGQTGASNSTAAQGSLGNPYSPSSTPAPNYNISTNYNPSGLSSNPSSPGTNTPTPLGGNLANTVPANPTTPSGTQSWQYTQVPPASQLNVPTSAQSALTGAVTQATPGQQIYGNAIGQTGNAALAQLQSMPKGGLTADQIRTLLSPAGGYSLPGSAPNGNVGIPFTFDNSPQSTGPVFNPMTNTLIFPDGSSQNVAGPLGYTAMDLGQVSASQGGSADATPPGYTQAQALGLNNNNSSASPQAQSNPAAQSLGAAPTAPTIMPPTTLTTPSATATQTPYGVTTTPLGYTQYTPPASANTNSSNTNSTDSLLAYLLSALYQQKNNPLYGLLSGNLGGL